jgi:hypothetical protein
MSKNKIKKLIPIVVLFILCLILLYVYKTPDKKDLNLNTNITEAQSETAVLEINGVKYEEKISNPNSIYTFMSQLQKEGKITFKDKTYSGMGKFIEDINGIKNGEKNWIYCVNEKKAEIGVSNYQINNGDIVSWKYE